jgi:plasmid stabilization system protein ParE
MKIKFNIVYLQLAFYDLLEIFDYIRLELKSPKAAQDLMIKLDEAISNLQYFPNSGKKYLINDKFESEYRYLIVDHYLIFYTVNINNVEIRRVIYSKRLYNIFL